MAATTSRSRQREALIQEIKASVTGCLKSFSVSFCPRLCNRVAHELAACTCSPNANLSWDGMPTGLESLVAGDLTVPWVNGLLFLVKKKLELSKTEGVLNLSMTTVYLRERYISLKWFGPLSHSNFLALRSGCVSSAPPASFFCFLCLTYRPHFFFGFHALLFLFSRSLFLSFRWLFSLSSCWFHFFFPHFELRFRRRFLGFRWVSSRFSSRLSIPLLSRDLLYWLCSP